MRSSLVLAAALLLAAADPATAQAPRFEDYPARITAPARNAPAVIATAEERRYRTRIRAAAAQRPDFAGAYVMAIWGCGTDCVWGAAVDTRSGRVTFLPAVICCIFAAGDAYADKVEYRGDSRLMILTGMRDEAESDLGRHYYRLEGGRFVHMLDVPLPRLPQSP